MKCDDNSTFAIGTWAAVQGNCRQCKEQPLLLFFEAVQ